MKKLSAVLIVLFLLASVSMPAHAAKAFTQKSSGMRIGLGSYMLGGFTFSAVNLGGMGSTMVRFVGDSFSGGIGANFLSLNANNANTSSIGIIGQMTFNITGGDVPMHLGVNASFNSVQNANAFSIGLLYGAESIVGNNILVGFDVIPLVYISSGNTNAFGLGSAAVYTTFLF